MPERLLSPYGADKLRDGGAYVKFDVANLAAKTFTALNNPAKIIS